MVAPVHPVPTLAMEAFLGRPVALWEIPAHDILNGVDRAYREACKPRRQRIEDALERLEDLRGRLIARLDAMDGDPDLEPFLSATDLIDQRLWSLGGATDKEDEHDGCEPDVDDEIDDHYGGGWPDEGDQSKFYPLKPWGA